MLALQGYDIGAIRQPEKLALTESQMADLAGNASVTWDSGRRSFEVCIGPLGTG